MCPLIPALKGVPILVVFLILGCEPAATAPPQPTPAPAANPQVVESALSAELLPADPDVSNRFPVLVRLTNDGPGEVVVFRPLDGSDYGWHLPHYRFEVTTMSGEVLGLLGRCGVSGLWAGTTWPESFAVTLAPGESFEVKFSPPQITGPGTYRIRFAYEYRIDESVQARFPTPPNAWVGIAEAPEVVVTFPADEPAKRLPAELREYLKEARVEAVEFRLSTEEEPRLRLSEREEIAALVRSFVDALAADGLQEGKQRHRPTTTVRIRFVVEDGPDVRLIYVGLDMFWTAMSDEPEWGTKLVNLQTPALTRCFAEYLERLPARPELGADDRGRRLAGDLREYLKEARVEAVEFRLSSEEEPRLRLSEREEIAALVRSFVNALAADDLQEGRQRHTNAWFVRIRFIIEDGPDVQLDSVGLDMFWTVMSDEEPESRPERVNLQTPALTRCFAEYLEKLPAHPDSGDSPR